MQFHLGVFIGRFQPFHLGHLDLITRALSHCQHLLILLGSSFAPRDYFNPFSFEERCQMILSCLDEEQVQRVILLPLVDYTYRDLQWVQAVQVAVDEARIACDLPDDAKIVLIGHAKDGSSFYLKLFPQWPFINMPNYKFLSATPLREVFFLQQQPASLRRALPVPVLEFLDGFAQSADYLAICHDYLTVQDYKKPFQSLPYPPIFVTVNSCVIQVGHILLIERKSPPGQGLWALPGGFLDGKERIEEGIYRELIEQTAIDVTEAVLRNATWTVRVFDGIYRSSRGRTITHAGLIRLPDGPLPQVQGHDDAAQARWWPFDSILPQMMFEDHYAIICVLMGE